MIDEEHFDALADGEVRGLAQNAGQLLEVMVKERAEHVAPVSPREPPCGRAEDVVLAALRVGEEAPLPQRVRQPKDAAAVDADEVGQLFQRYRRRRPGHRFEDGQAAVETLNRRGVVRGLSAHWGGVVNVSIPHVRCAGGSIAFSCCARARRMLSSAAFDRIAQRPFRYSHTNGRHRHGTNGKESACDEAYGSCWVTVWRRRCCCP